MKWTVCFGGSLVDMLHANSYSTYIGIHANDKRVRRHGQSMSLSPRQWKRDFIWAFGTLKNKKKSPFELPDEDVSEQERVAAHPNEEYHMHYKTTCIMKKNKWGMSKSEAWVFEH
eukprot:13755942-Ditylum_brightwellii.AAC.2